MIFHTHRNQNLLDSQKFSPLLVVCLNKFAQRQYGDQLFLMWNTLINPFLLFQQWTSLLLRKTAKIWYNFSVGLSLRFLSKNSCHFLIHIVHCSPNFTFEPSYRNIIFEIVKETFPWAVCIFLNKFPFLNLFFFRLCKI